MSASGTEVPSWIVSTLALGGLRSLVMTASGRPQRNAAIEVFNDYRLIGDPRFGNFAVYIDGVKAGVAVLGGSVVARVEPGPHTIRVRYGWYLSPRVDVDVEPAELARFGADVPREGPLAWRMLKLFFDPFHSLTLVKDDGHRLGRGRGG